MSISAHGQRGHLSLTRYAATDNKMSMYVHGTRFFVPHVHALKALYLRQTDDPYRAPTSIIVIIIPTILFWCSPLKVNMINAAPFAISYFC